MEYMDLYDIDKVRNGITLARGSKVSGGYSLCAQIVVINAKGQILIQQRQDHKLGFPGAWDLSVCGLVQSGENSRQGAARELREELGIDYDFEGRRPNVCISFSEGYTDVYVIRKDVPIEDIKIQKEEVKAARWASLEEILEMVEDGRFVPYYPSWIRFLWEAGGRYGSIDGSRVKPGQL